MFDKAILFVDGVDGSHSRHQSAKLVVVINNHEQKEPPL